MHSVITRDDLTQEDLPQQDHQLVLLCADRHVRAAHAMEPWAKNAKKCIDYVEGRQWTAADLAKAEEEGRPALTFNKIAPLVRLILGYHRNNRVDAKFLPDDAGVASEAVGQALTKLDKRTSETNQLPYIDGEVFTDGIMTGRGFYDQRLDFTENMLGELKITAKDPLTIGLDPDGSTYDINETCNFVFEDRQVSIEDIEFTYGRGAAALIYPMVCRSGYGGMPSSLTEYAEQFIVPWRTFGGEFSRDMTNQYMGVAEYLGAAFDPARKTARLVDMQHKVRVWRRYFADLETGAIEPVPDHYSDDKIKMMLAWSAAQFAAKGQPCPLRVIRRMGTRVRWTTMVGDIVVYDKWSPYETYTLTGFFPWFNRGSTRGAVDDLLDPQDEVNKRRSATIDIITRTAHSGWLINEGGMRPEEQEKLENYGAAPGINVKWKGEPHQKPEKIGASTAPMAMERLEQRGSDDIREISGVNNELMGLDETVKSGRAIEARQRQGVMAIQVYMDNMSRTKELCARKRLEIYQRHYTERRTFRITGDKGKDELITFNDRQAAAELQNDLTIGKYRISIDETPLSATFAAAQLEELKDAVSSGMLPVEVMQDTYIDLSSIPNKEMAKKRLATLQQAQGIPTAEQLENGQVPTLIGPDGMPMQSPQQLPQPAAQPAGAPV